MPLVLGIHHPIHALLDHCLEIKILPCDVLFSETLVQTASQLQSSHLKLLHLGSSVLTTFLLSFIIIFFRFTHSNSFLLSVDLLFIPPDFCLSLFILDVLESY